jgi:hypothetical protein
MTQSSHDDDDDDDVCRYQRWFSCCVKLLECQLASTRPFSPSITLIKYVMATFSAPSKQVRQRSHQTSSLEEVHRKVKSTAKGLVMIRFAFHRQLFGTPMAAVWPSRDMCHHDCIHLPELIVSFVFSVVFIHIHGTSHIRRALSPS